MPVTVEGKTLSAGDYARSELARLAPEARAEWEKAHGEEAERAFQAARTTDDLKAALDKYALSSKTDDARLRKARLHYEKKQYKEAVETLREVRGEFYDRLEADAYFEAFDLQGLSFQSLHQESQAAGIYRKMLADISRDPKRLGSIKARVEARRKDVKEEWEKNAPFVFPLKKAWSAKSLTVASRPGLEGTTLDAFSPVVAESWIYTLDPKGKLEAQGLDGGKVVWEAGTEDFSALFNASNNLTLLPMDPLMAVKDGLLAVGGRNVRVFEAATGKQLWTQGSEGDSAVHQVVLEGKTLLAYDTKGRLSAFEARSGKPLWSARPGAGGSGIIIDRSSMTGGGLFHSHAAVEGGKVVAQPAGEPGCLFAYDLASGKLLWKATDFTFQGYVKGKPVVSVGGGVACIGDAAGQILCHDLADGKVRWKSSTGALPVESLAAACDRVLVTTQDHAILYNAKTGKREWMVPMDASSQMFPRDKDMRLGATSSAVRGKWALVATAGSARILDLATGKEKDTLPLAEKGEPTRGAGSMLPFGKSYTSVTVGPDGILWRALTDTGFHWVLYR